MTRFRLRRLTTGMQDSDTFKWRAPAVHEADRCIPQSVRASSPAQAAMLALSLYALAACDTQPRQAPGTADRDAAPAAAPTDATSHTPSHSRPARPTDAPPGAASQRPAPGGPNADADSGADSNANPNANPANTNTADIHAARRDGFGPLRLGMSTREAVDAWPGLYAGRPRRIAARGCDFAQVPGAPLAYFTLMFDGGRFVRFGGGNEAVAAPGGGTRGMDVAALQARYGNALLRVPDPERPRGPGYRLVRDTPGALPTRLAFVIDGGKVVEWSVGLVEGKADHTIACAS